MSKFYKFVLLLLLCFIIPYICSLLCYNKIYDSKDMSRYLVVKNGDETVGYIFGSMHCGLTEEELGKDKSHILELLPQVKNVFFEALIGHWATYKTGLDKLALEQIEKSKIQFTNVKGLETLRSQQALIKSLYFYGNDLYYLPYGNLFMSYPGVADMLNYTNNLMLLIPNLLYQRVLNPNFLKELHKANSLTIANTRSSFLQGRTGIVSSRLIEQFRVVSRDSEMYKTLKDSMKNYSSENKFLIVIGSAHVSATKGILSHFIEDGYDIQELQFVNP